MRKGKIKNIENIALVSSAVMGLCTGAFFGVKSQLPLTKHDEESIYNRKMVVAERRIENYFSKHGDNLEIAIESTTGKNIEMDNVKNTLLNHLSDKYSKEAKSESEIISKHKLTKDAEALAITVAGGGLAIAGMYAGTYVGMYAYSKLGKLAKGKKESELDDYEM